MNVPQLRFDGFDEEWEKILFKDIFFEKTERTNDMSQYPLFSLTVEKGVTPKTDRYERSFLVKEGNDNYKIVNPNDFVYNPMNLTLGAVAKHKKNINISVSGYYNVFSTNPKFNSDFLEMYLKSYKMILHYKAIATGSLIEKQRVHFSQFVKIKRPIPSLKEQNKIGSFFAKLDQRIEKQQEKIEKLEQFKKGMMQKIFSQELRFKGADGGEYPEWEEKLLNQISIINPKTEPLRDEFYYIDLESVDKGRVGELRTVNIENAPSRAQRVLTKGDVLFQTVRPYQQNHYYLEELLDQQIVASTGFAQIRTDQSSQYIYYLMHTEEFAQEVLNRCTGTSYPAINSSHLAKIKVPVPSLAEQKKIADFLFSLDKKLNKEIEKLMVLEEQKKGFMQGMFV